MVRLRHAPCPNGAVNLGTMNRARLKRTITQQPLRALVVDDREDVAMGLALMLKKLGHTVQVAYHALGALQLGERLRPDVVFLDIGLPDRSGYDVCKEMRQSDWGANAFIVAVTGRNEAEDMIRAAHSGFDRHVGKPMDLSTLQEIVHTVNTRAAYPGPQAVTGNDPRPFD